MHQKIKIDDHQYGILLLIKFQVGQYSLNASNIIVSYKYIALILLYLLILMSLYEI